MDIKVLHTTTDNAKSNQYIYNQSIKWSQNKDCLHDNCSMCEGSGIRKDGLGSCIHMISCPCEKCSPRL